MMYYVKLVVCLSVRIYLVANVLNVPLMTRSVYLNRNVCAFMVLLYGVAIKSEKLIGLNLRTTTA